MRTIDPDRLTHDQRRTVDAWLEANGARWHVALEPVTITRGVIEYTALCRRDADTYSLGYNRRTGDVTYYGKPLRRRRLHQRIPLPAL